MNTRYLLLAALLTPALTTVGEFEPECVGTSIHVSVHSHRNQTGHWQSKIQLSHDPRHGVEIHRWNVDVGQHTKDCGSSKSFVLEITTTSPPPPPPAGAGYELFPGLGYYKFHPEAVTWEEGRQACGREGAHLVVVNSHREAAVMTSLFARHLKVSNVTVDGVAAVGFHDRDVEGHHVTIFGEPLANTGYSLWARRRGGEDGDDADADAHPGEDCGSIHRNGMLEDVLCSLRIPFICEHEL